MSNKKNKKVGYGETSIESLEGPDRVRLRPASLLGSSGIEGSFHLFHEILGNSIDEIKAGYGDKIEVVWHVDNAVTVRDYGRGIPMDWNEKEKRYNWDLVFCELYAGGKYSDENYSVDSIGLNGLGCTCVQYVSTYMEVESIYGGKKYAMNFKEGYPVGKLKVTNSKEPSGTKIKYLADSKVFDSTAFTKDMFLNVIESQSYLNGIKISFKDERESKKLYDIDGTGGLEAFLQSKIEGKNLLEDLYVLEEESKGVVQVSESGIKGNYTAIFRMVLGFTTEDSEDALYLPFHNTGEMRQGVHHEAFKKAFVDFFRVVSRQQKVKIEAYDYWNKINCILATSSNYTSYIGQTKFGITNDFIFKIIYDTVYGLLETEYAKGFSVINMIVDLAVEASEEREQLKELRRGLRKAKRMTNNRNQRVDKFLDCTIKKADKRELYITEGDSAKSACKDGRDRNFQAIFPIRGKIINCLKATLKDILNNKEVQDLVTLIGTGVDVKLGKNEESLFDIKKLKYGKIIFATDGDVDGFQIRVLLYTVFHRLMPELLKGGYVYVVESPLYEIKVKGKKKSLFAYSRQEMEKIVKKNPGATVMRSKGLGENNADMMWETTMNPETRRLVQLQYSENPLVDILFGNDKKNRRREVILRSLDANFTPEESEAV